MFSFGVDVRFGVNIFIDLVNIRSVEVGVSLRSTVSLYAYFGYGCPGILEAGAFIRG